MDKKNILKKVGIGVLVGAVAVGGFSFYHHQQRISDFHRVAEAKTQMVAHEAEKNNVTLIDEAQVKTIAADAMGVDEAKITWNEIFLMERPGRMGLHHRGAFGPQGRPDMPGQSEQNGMQGQPAMDAEYFCGPNGPRGRRGYGNGGQGYGCWDQGQGQGYGCWDQGQEYGPHHRSFDGKLQEKATNDSNNSGDIKERPALPPQENNLEAKESATQSDSNGNKVRRFDFHPVYNVMCEANGVRYNVRIDAVSGEVYGCHVGRR